MPQIRRWHIYPDADDMHRHAAAAIIRAAEQAIAARAKFRIVLSGGNTPQPLYALLRSARTDWSRWEIYFGDERCVPAASAERNDAAAVSAWLAHVPIPVEQIHRIPAELGAEQAATQYAAVVAPVDRFDLVLLGIGEDGHTASLFPHHRLDAMENVPEVVAVEDAPKPPRARVSLSPRRLARTRQAFFLVSGASKQDAIAAWTRGEPLPAAWITPEDGVDILVDRSAMPTGVPLRF